MEMFLLFLGFILGIFGNWIAANMLPSLPAVTDWAERISNKYENWRAKRSIRTAQKRIEKLEHQLDVHRKYMQNTTIFAASVIQDVMRIFLYTVATISLFGIPYAIKLKKTSHDMDTLTSRVDGRRLQIFSEETQRIIDDILTSQTFMIIGAVLIFIFVSFAQIKIVSILFKSRRIEYFEIYEIYVKSQIEDLRNFIQSRKITTP